MTADIPPTMQRSSLRVSHVFKYKRDVACRWIMRRRAFPRTLLCKYNPVDLSGRFSTYTTTVSDNRPPRLVFPPNRIFQDDSTSEGNRSGAAATAAAKAAVTCTRRASRTASRAPPPALLVVTRHVHLSCSGSWTIKRDNDEREPALAGARRSLANTPGGHSRSCSCRWIADNGGGSIGGEEMPLVGGMRGLGKGFGVGIGSKRYGVNAGAGRTRGMSSFLADALRETATNHGIDKICNGVTTSVDDPTVEVQDFVYDIDFRQRPSHRYQPVANAPDPFELVAGDISGLSDGIKSLIGTDHPVLNAAAKYFFELDGGKKIRPTMVILMGHACNSHARQLRPGVFAGDEAHEPLHLRLAEITEMIHAASLFHDDVIDEADTRRGVPSVNKVFGNKLAILAGDFLLARSSMSLARLRSLESVELMSAAIEHLVKGEVLQMRPTERGGGAFEYYVRKNYYKTGSLMANSCKAAAVLGEHDVKVQDVAFEYGKRVGLAFQLVDDILDFEGNAFTLGKPALNDLRQGLATAPVLLAAEQQSGLDKLIKRKFKGPGDVDEALALVHASDGIARARDVAVVQAEKAMDAVLTLKQSPARDALVQLAHKIVNRNH